MPSSRHRPAERWPVLFLPSISAMTDFHFSFPIAVRYSDLDAQGHLNHARYLSFMEEARFQYVIAVGLWNNQHDFNAVGQIVAEAKCVYKRPVFIGQTVEVAMRVSRLGNKSLEMDYRLTVKDEEVATGHTVQVAYDYVAQHSIIIPIEWREKLQTFEGRSL